MAENQKNYIDQLKKEASEALSSTESLFKSKNYMHSLFFLHLATEKILKAVYAKKTAKIPPPIHNLLRLAQGSNLILDNEITRELLEITDFNISTRYEEYKSFFYRKANRKYAQIWLIKGKKLFNYFSNLLENET